VKVGTTVCNLLACAATNKAAIKAGALSVLKVLATMDFEVFFPSHSFFEISST
jgi:hypothetical protein